MYSSAVFSPAKRKSRPVTRARGREVERRRVAFERQLRQRRPARVAEPEQPRALVERLAGGVVERLAERLVAVRGRVTRASSVWPPLASRQMNGGSKAVPRKFAATWPWRWSTGGQRQPARGGEPLRGRDADQQRADEPGPLRDRDQLRVVERRAGRVQRRRPRPR